MTPKQRDRSTPKDYNVFFKDGSYMTYTLKKSDYDAITHAMTHSQKWAVISFGAIDLSDVRSIVECKESKQAAPEENKAGEPVLDAESAAWVKEHLGVEVIN